MGNQCVKEIIIPQRSIHICIDDDTVNVLLKVYLNEYNKQNGYIDFNYAYIRADLDNIDFDGIDSIDSQIAVFKTAMEFLKYKGVIELRILKLDYENFIVLHFFDFKDVPDNDYEMYLILDHELNHL